MIWTQLAGARNRAIVGARAKRAAATITVLGILVTASVVSGASDAAFADSYPSWVQVQQANANVAAKQAEITQLQSLISSLDAQVAATQAIAKVKGDAYGTAQDAYYAAAVQQQTLEQQAAAEKVLDGVGNGGRVSARAESIYRTALQDQRTAQALTDQASVAKSILNSLKAVAQAAYEVAQAASDAAQAALDAQSAHKTELQAQLASLTTDATMTQAQYIAGLKVQFGIDGVPDTEIASSGWALPTRGLISSGFGMRINPFNGIYQLHDGTDMAHGCSQPIYAGHAGTVDYAGWSGALGEFVRIQDDGTYSTGYGHIAAGQILVHSGQQVQVGQLIGRTGETGTATGCHLHYMVIINGVPVDPVPFMRSQGITLGQV
jgi:murein DD-endopeptidase MepM/ murein hydrolase activator NlpD